MDPVEKLAGEIEEKRKFDQKQAEERQRHLEIEGGKSALQKMQEAFPGQEIYALAVTVQCPWSHCARRYTVGFFMPMELGENFHIRCQDCRENFVTLRDTVIIHGNNTFPVELVKMWQQKKGPQYETWLNVLRDFYAKADVARGQAWDRTRFRESDLTFGEGNKTPIRVRTSVQTPAEAHAELQEKQKLTGPQNPLLTAAPGEIMNLLHDPEVMKKYWGS